MIQKMMWLCVIVLLQNMGQKRWFFLLAVFACLFSSSCGRGDNGTSPSLWVSLSLIKKIWNFCRMMIVIGKDDKFTLATEQCDLDSQSGIVLIYLCSLSYNESRQNLVNLWRLFFLLIAVLKLKSDDDRPVYNHTLAITLVEYTSAVS